MRFEEWYERCRPRVLAAMVVAVGDVDRAADATDEAMTRALQRWESVATMQSPLGWTMRVALNVAKRRGRREQIERRLLGRSVPPHDVPAAAGEAWMTVAELPARQREVLVLHYMLDMKQDEIAETLGVSRSAVSSALTDARRRLASEFSEPTVRPTPTRLEDRHA